MQRSWLTRTLVLLAFSGACASSPSPATAAHAPYTLEVEDAHGRPLPRYHHRGTTYVQGKLGERYAIRVRNHTSRRVEAVVTVDGRDVLSGEVGDYVRQRGYVIGPYDAVRIEGFRTSWHGVAAFRFGHPGESYSSRMGTPENVGIIGVAFFEERPGRRPRRSHVARPDTRAGRGGEKAQGANAPKASDGRDARARRRPSHSRGSASSEAAPRHGHSRRHGPTPFDDHSHIGTEYGEQRVSHARQVRFHRRAPRRPARVLTVRYDDARGLAERGIRLHPRAPRGPRAFPVTRFAPPPPRR